MRTCRPTVGSAPSRLVKSPRRHSGRSSTNNSRRRLPRPRNGLVGHRSWTLTNNHDNCYPQVTGAIAFLPVFSTGTAGRVKLKLLYWERVKKKDHVPHVIFFEDTLFTHASFVHQCVFTTGTAGSRQGHPSTWQAHSHSGTPLTAGGPGFQ